MFRAEIVQKIKMHYV